MYKLSLIASILVVFTVGSHAQLVLGWWEQPPNPLEVYATTLLQCSQNFKCAAQSCDKSSFQKVSSLTCEAIDNIKALPEITADSLTIVTNTVINGSLAIEPKCKYSSFTGCRKRLPHQISNLAAVADKTARLIGCIDNPTPEIVKEVNGYFLQFATILGNSEAEGLQCSNVFYRAFKVLRKNLKKLCY